jgi:hypothetical protein
VGSDFEKGLLKDIPIDKQFLFEELDLKWDAERKKALLLEQTRFKGFNPNSIGKISIYST